MPEYKNLRVWVKTAENLKILAALRKVSVLRLLDELVQREMESEPMLAAQKAKTEKGK